MLVCFIVPNPEKYPLNTDDADTNKIAGANTFNTYFTSGTFNKLVAMNSAPKNNNNEKISPIIVNKYNEVLNILYAALWFPTASLSDTNFDITFGIPIDDKVNNNAYIWYPVE